MKVQWLHEKSLKPLVHKGFRLSCYYSHSMVAGGFEVMS